MSATNMASPNMSTAISKISAKYVKGIAKVYAGRGENCQFEVHQLPGVSDEEFLETITKYGLKKTTGEMAGAPQVHFVVWNYDSEYYEKKLKPLVDAERERQAESVKKYLEEQRLLKAGSSSKTSKSKK